MLVLLCFSQNLYAETLQRNLLIEPSDLDPQAASIGAEVDVALDLFEGLFTYNAKGEIIPGVVESWSISNDQKVYTFYLKENLRWSDGKALTTKDFIYSFRRALKAKNGFKNISFLFPIKNAREFYAKKVKDFSEVGVKALSSSILQIELKVPTPYFLELLAHPIYAPIPIHTVEKYGKDWLKRGKFVSNGAFSLERWKLSDKIVLNKNKYYYDASKVNLERVVYNYISDASTALRMYRGKELDLLTQFSSSDIPLVKKLYDKELRVFPQMTTYYLIFNLKKSGQLTKEQRQALSMVIDRKYITEYITKTGEIPTEHFIPNGMTNYTSPKIDWTDWSKEQRIIHAKTLFQDEKQDITLSYNSDYLNEKVLMAIRYMWETHLPVNVHLEQREGRTHYDRLHGGKFDVGRAAWQADYNDPEGFLFLFTERAGTYNYSGYQSEYYDELFDASYFNSDILVRNRQLQELESIILAEQVVIPIYQYVSRNLVSEKIQGWKDNLMDRHLSRFLSLR